MEDSATNLICMINGSPQKDHPILQKDIEDRTDWNQLKEELETLYTGPENNFTLRAPKNFFCKIDKIFDELILEHGITTVEFTYDRIPN